MSEYDAATYERFSNAVQRQVQSLRIILESLQVNSVQLADYLIDNLCFSLLKLSSVSLKTIATLVDFEVFISPPFASELPTSVKQPDRGRLGNMCPLSLTCTCVFSG